MGKRATEAADSILVVRVGALGDTLMALPAAAALQQTHPGARVDFLCSASAAPLVRLFEGIGEVHALRQRNFPYLLSPEKWKLCRQLKSRGYRLAVLLEAAPRYRLLLEKAGIPQVRSFRETPFDPGLHAAANNLRAAGLDWTRFPLQRRLSPGAEDRKAARKLLDGLAPPRVGLHAGYGPAGKKKDQSQRLKGWGGTHFARLAEMLLEAGTSLVFTGSAEDREEAARIASGLPPERVRLLAGQTSVGQLAGVIAESQLFISVDSGPAHLAAALGTPLIVLWGPAKLQQVRPLPGAGPVVVIRHAVPCAPCYDTPAMKSCRRNICMQSITPWEVMAEARQLLEHSAN